MSWTLVLDETSPRLALLAGRACAGAEAPTMADATCIRTPKVLGFATDAVADLCECLSRYQPTEYLIPGCASSRRGRGTSLFGCLCLGCRWRQLYARSLALVKGDGISARGSATAPRLAQPAGHRSAPSRARSTTGVARPGGAREQICARSTIAAAGCPV